MNSPKASTTTRAGRTPIQERSIASRNAILEAARKLLQENPLAPITIRGVAKASGVGVGTVYEYFPTKSDILYIIMKERVDLRLKILDKHYSDMSTNISFEDRQNAYVEEMGKEKLWSRMDVALLGEVPQDDKLADLRNGLLTRLAKRYVAIAKAYGSKWSDDSLEEVARYLIKLDVLNGQLQISATESERALHGQLTLTAFSSIFEYTQTPG